MTTCSVPRMEYLAKQNNVLRGGEGEDEDDEGAMTMVMRGMMVVVMMRRVVPRVVRRVVSRVSLR